MLASFGRVAFFLPYSFYAEHTACKWFPAGKDTDYFLYITSFGVAEVWVLEAFLAISPATMRNAYKEEMNVGSSLVYWKFKIFLGFECVCPFYFIFLTASWIGFCKFKAGKDFQVSLTWGRGDGMLLGRAPVWAPVWVWAVRRAPVRSSHTSLKMTTGYPGPKQSIVSSTECCCSFNHLPQEFLRSPCLLGYPGLPHSVARSLLKNHPAGDGFLT